MYCFGLTGSIASGKSTVAKIFSQLGIDIISADHIAKALVQPNQPALEKIIQHFGPSITLDNGELNRRHLRELIINNPEDRLWLENLLHPLIRETIQQDIFDCKSPYCIIEIPLLTSTLNYPYLNRVLLILATPEQQVTRIQTRDKCSKQQASALLETTRIEDEKRLKIADDVIVNDGSLEVLQQQVLALHAKYLLVAKK